jgi:hypothetical protein
MERVEASRRRLDVAPVTAKEKLLLLLLAAGFDRGKSWKLLTAAGAACPTESIMSLSLA